MYNSNTIIIEIMTIISFQLNPKLYLRDPQSSELGRKIIQASIRMIDKWGFDDFTFKKLAREINSTEASVYRYFENKHRLLLYLIDWYWTWLEFTLDYRTQNIRNASDKLRIAIQVLVEEKQNEEEFAFVNEKQLQRIVNTEFEKTYLTRQVDTDNKDGLFLPYKSLCKKIASIVRQINPKFPYPHALVSTLMLTAKHQLYYAEHLPSLTEIKFDARNKLARLTDFLETVTLNTLTSRGK